VLLWWVDDDDRLGRDARAAIADGGSEVFVSAISIWEVEIKRALGKMTADEDLVHHVHTNAFSALPVRFEHATQVGLLPPVHRDPFDRMLVAQAQVEGLTIVTGDRAISRYPVAVLAA